MSSFEDSRNTLVSIFGSAKVITNLLEQVYLIVECSLLYGHAINIVFFRTSALEATQLERHYGPEPT